GAISSGTRELYVGAGWSGQQRKRRGRQASAPQRGVQRRAYLLEIGPIANLHLGVQPQAPEIVQIGLDGERTIKACDRFIEASKLDQHLPAMAEGFGITGLEHDGPVAAREGLVEAPEFGQRHAAIVEGFTEVWLERDRAIVTRERVVKSLQLGEHVATLVESLGKVGIERNRVIVACERILEPREVFERIPAVDTGVDIVRRQGVRPTVARNRFRKATQLGEDDAAIVVRRSRARIDRQGIIDASQRAAMIAELVCDDTKHVQAVEMRRLL